MTMSLARAPFRIPDGEAPLALEKASVGRSSTGGTSGGHTAALLTGHILGGGQPAAESLSR